MSHLLFRAVPFGSVYCVVNDVGPEDQLLLVVPVQSDGAVKILQRNDDIGEVIRIEGDSTDVIAPGKQQESVDFWRVEYCRSSRLISRFIYYQSTLVVRHCSRIAKVVGLNPPHPQMRRLVFDNYQTCPVPSRNSLRQLMPFGNYPTQARDLCICPTLHVANSLYIGLPSAHVESL